MHYGAASVNISNFSGGKEFQLVFLKRGSSKRILISFPKSDKRTRIRIIARYRWNAPDRVVHLEINEISRDMDSSKIHPLHESL